MSAHLRRTHSLDVLRDGVSIGAPGPTVGSWERAAAKLAMGKAWAWISWIQGSSFLVGLGHILFQLRQL